MIGNICICHEGDNQATAWPLARCICPPKSQPQKLKIGQLQTGISVCVCASHNRTRIITLTHTSGLAHETEDLIVAAFQSFLPPPPESFTLLVERTILSVKDKCRRITNL